MFMRWIWRALLTMVGGFLWRKGKERWQNRSTSDRRASGAAY
jgi:hypothetical protein